MAQINTIDKNTNNIAKSNVGGMLFPANGTDHQLLMAYYLKWGLHLSDGESLDTTEDVINYLLIKIDDLYNKISGIEDQTEYTIIVSSSSMATCNTSKIKKSGGTITITPNSGLKITNVTATNCTITHIDNSNKYQITNVIGNIILTVNTQGVNIKINGEDLSKLTITREKNNTLNSITQNGGKINPTSITINETSRITSPTSLTLIYGNNEGSVNLIFSGTDINSTPDVTVDSSKLTKSNLTNSGVKLTSKGVTGQTTVVIKFTDANNLYEKIFNINVTITNENSSENISNGWEYSSSNPDVAAINGLTITGKSVGTSNIAISYEGKWTSLGTLTVKEEEVTINYYWYVGQENPANMTSISPIVTNNTSPGWRLIGTSIPTYSVSNKLWDGVTNGITFNARDIYYYIVPSSNIKIYDDTGASVMDVFTTSEVTIEGVKYYVYTSNSKARGVAWMVY